MSCDAELGGVKKTRANPELWERCGPAGNTTRFVKASLASDEMILPTQGFEQK